MNASLIDRSATRRNARLKTPWRFGTALRLLALTSLLLACVPWAAAADPKAAQFYEDALTRFEKKDYAGATIQLKNAIKADRKMLPVHVLLGKVLLANSDMVGAEVAFNEALNLGVNRAEVVLPLARALLGQGKPQLLISDPRFSTTGLPASVQAPLWLVQAQAQADLGRMREALKAIDESRVVEASTASSWLAEVPIRIRARQFPEAASAAEKAISLAPTSAEAHYLRGSIDHAQGGLAGALAEYDKALALQPAHLESLVARAGIRLDMNQIGPAKIDIAALRKAQPKEPRGAYLIAVIAEREGNALLAKAAMTEIISLLDPVPMEFMRYRPQLLILGGLAHFGLGQREKARPYLELVQRDQPASASSKLLAQIHLADKNVDRAIESLEFYLRGFPRDSQALALLASAHMSQGRYARATQITQDALKTQDSPRLRTMLGLSLVGGGKAGDAITEFEAAYKKDPRQIQAGAALVNLYLNARQYKKAVLVADAIAKQQPGRPGLLNLLGMARRAAGDVPGARSAFDEAAKRDPAFVDARLNLARLDIQARNFEPALERLNVILKANDKHVDTLSELGMLAESRGQAAEATRWLERAADHAAAADLQPALSLVDHHLRGGRVELAQAAVKRLGLKAPDDLLVLIAFARVQLAGKNPDAARSYLTRANRLANFDAGAQTRIALLQMAADDPKGAAYSLSKALQSEPDNLAALALMTDVDIRLADLPKAEQRARDIVLKYPKAALGYALTGDVANARGQTGAALEAYRRAYQLEPSSESMLRLYRALTPKDGVAATQLADQWVKFRPSDIAARRALADGHARNGNLAAARNAYEALLKLTPGDAEALNNFAHVLLLQKDAGALRIAERALAAKPNAAHIIGTTGWAAFQAGQKERSLQLLRDARLRDPDNAETRYFLAAVLANTGRKTEARDELEAALRSGRSFPSAAEAQVLLQTLK